MSYKTTQRPVQQAKQRPLTDEEKQARIIQFLQQKREAFSVNILKGLCSNPAMVDRKRVVGKDGSFTETAEINNGSLLVNKAVKMADELLEKLYPINDEVHKAAEE